MPCVVSPAATSNTAIHKYVNQKKVPHILIASGASKWGNPKQFPWSMGWQPDYHTEGLIYAKHALATVKDPKIGILRQNDDMGVDYLDGFMEGLNNKIRVIQRRAYGIKNSEYLRLKVLTSFIDDDLND